MFKFITVFSYIAKSFMFNNIKKYFRTKILAETH